MNKQTLFLLAFFAAILPAMEAQNLLPFLAKSGQYGFVDASGKMVIEPQFTGRVEPFFEKTLSIDCQKAGESVRLFRNGLALPNPHLTMHRSISVVNVDANYGRLDSIGHLVAFQNESKWQVLDLRTGGKLAETYQEDFLNLPEWAKMRTFSYNNGSEFYFRYGVMRVLRADGRLNFLDENLREILPKDVATGVVADADFLIFAEGQDRFGVADRIGKTVVAPGFRSLEPTGKPGLFLANKQRNGSIGEKWHCGLVRSDGKMVIDTIFSDIEKVEGADLFIVRNVGKTGLFNAEGREIVPIGAETGYSTGKGFSMFKWPNGGGMNLYDRQGKAVFDKNVTEVKANTIAKKLFFEIKKGNLTAILDTTLTVLAQDSVNYLTTVEANPLLFLVQKKDGPNRLVSIRDAAGKMLVDGKFESVWTAPGWPDGLRFIYLNKLKGIADKNFNAVLPPIFEEIVLEQTHRDTFIWAKKPGEPLFMAFDKRGKRRSDIEDAPDARRESVYGVVVKMQAIPGGGYMATIFDGTQIKWPDSLKNQRGLSSFRTKTGGAVVVGFDQKRITAVLDHRFRNLLPAGFTVPDKSASEMVLERFSQFGLLVVKKLPDEMPGPKPTIPASTIEETGDVKISDAPVQAYPSNYGIGSGTSKKKEPVLGAACGVIDLDGRWVIEPKADVEFLPLSPFVVAEFPAGAKSSSHDFFEKGIRLHRIQPAEKGVIEANWLGQDRFDPKDGNNMKIGRIRAGTTRTAEYAYFNQKGEPITDWIFENGPDFLKSKNLVHIWEKGVFGIRQAVIGGNGKTRFELGEWMTGDSPRTRGGDNDQWSYLRIQKRRTEIIKDSLGRLVPMPEGLMDTTGRVVLSPEYFDLQVWEKYRLLTAKTAEGKRVLMGFDGQVISEFKPSKSGISMEKIGRDNNGGSVGPLAVWTENETILVGEEGAILRRFDLPYGREPLSDKMAEQFVILLKNNQQIWADYRSGQVFWED